MLKMYTDMEVPLSTYRNVYMTGVKRKSSILQRTATGYKTRRKRDTARLTTVRAEILSP